MQPKVTMNVSLSNEDQALNTRGKVKTFDPQIEVEGRLHEGPQGEYIQFSIDVFGAPYQFSVLIPQYDKDGDGQDIVPVGGIQTRAVLRHDPRFEVQATLKEGPNSDIIVFSLPILLFEMTFIVTIPEVGKNLAPVYIKHKIKKPGFNRLPMLRPKAPLPVPIG